MSEKQSRVVVVGPNPAMDIVLDVPGFAAGRSWRVREALHLAGGKPMNVARTLRRLGIEVCLVSPLGGEFGPRRLIIDTCALLGIELRWCEISMETRTCVVVADSGTGESTVVNERGPLLSRDEEQAYQRQVEDVLQLGDLVLATGSLPPRNVAQLLRLARAPSAKYRGSGGRGYVGGTVATGAGGVPLGH